MTEFFERFRFSILRDLEWQAAARKAREQAEHGPLESNKPNSRIRVSSAPDAVSPATGAKEAP